MTKILIIDDDHRLAEPLITYFERFGFELKHVDHPDKGLAFIDSGAYALLILDVMLPDIDGFTLCKQIRQDYDIPIIMLTARGDVMDRVVGLELGADDYLAKPFEPRELVARIQNILKRYQKPASAREETIYQFEHLVINTSTETVLINEQKTPLTESEYRLLMILVSAMGSPVSRDELLNQLKGIDSQLFSRAIDIQISRLRQKLQPTNYIKTVRNKGYRFSAPTVAATNS